MKRAAIAIVFTLGLIGTASLVADFWREWMLVDEAGLSFSRLDIHRLQENHESVRFGAESGSAYLFALPDEEDGLSACGSNGFSGQRARGIEVFGVAEALSCTKTIRKGSGTVFRYVIFADKLYVDVSA